jgi:hypothetical protein
MMTTTTHPGSTTPTGLPGFLLYYADGHGPLWQAFWIWGVALSWILFGVFWFLGNAMGLTWGLFALATIVMMPYTAWILVSVWQCAFNVGNELWAYLARAVTLIWAANIGVAGGILLSELVLA